MLLIFRLAEESLSQACDRLYTFDIGTGQHDGVTAVINLPFRTLKGENVESAVNDSYSLHRPPEAAQAAGVVCVPEAWL